MVNGATDQQGRCGHYHSPKDIVAIKFKCCQQYYACIFCHEEAADHVPQVWPKEEFTEKAILCGNCKSELAIADYLQSNSQCPYCNALFNPKCSSHHHYYFEWQNP